MIDVSKLTIQSAHDALMQGNFTAQALTETYLQKIVDRNAELNVYLEVFSDALAQAKQADEKIRKGEATLLTGIPFGLKDNMLIDGKHVSAGSKILEKYTATYTGTVPKLLIDAGAVILGRTNMDEFAMGTSTENSAYGPSKNPHDTKRVPGGSSGGSAAGVAADLCLVALGSDTGGSVRQPAALCGVAGFKATYGTVSRHGLIAMGNSLDQIGPLAKTVQDIEIIHNMITTHDPMDATSIPLDERIKAKASIRPVKVIGVPWKEIDREGMDKEYLEKFKASMKKLSEAGYEIRDISLPLMPYALSVYYIIMPAEVSTNLSRFDGIRYGASVSADTLFDVYAKTRGNCFGPEVRRRIMLGTYVLSHGYYDAYYRKATKVRSAIMKEFEDIFKEVDVIATPASPTPAFMLGEKANDPLALYLADIFTVSANIVGVPALSVPNGLTKAGLPVDVQFMAPHFGEESLFTIGKVLEKVR